MCDVPHWAMITYEDRISKQPEIDEITELFHESTYHICDQLTKLTVSNGMLHGQVINALGTMRGFRM